MDGDVLGLDCRGVQDAGEFCIAFMAERVGVLQFWPDCQGFEDGEGRVDDRPSQDLGLDQHYIQY